MGAGSEFRPQGREGRGLNDEDLLRGRRGEVGRKQGSRCWGHTCCGETEGGEASTESERSFRS